MIAMVVVVEPASVGSTLGTLFRKIRIGTEPPVGALDGIIRFICHTPTSVGESPE